jgi:hypothetical protein
LTTALDKAARAGVVAKSLPVFLTEFGIQSVPDPFYGVPLLTQNAYRAVSELIAWRNPRVRSFSQYLLRDDLPKANATGNARYGGFESGLRTSDGKAKPALAGFRLPLVARREGGRVKLWGLVRPATAATAVQVQVRAGSGSWSILKTATTNARGVVQLSSTYRTGRTWRLRWAAPGGEIRVSPPVSSYVF